MPGFASLGQDQLQAVFEYVYYGKETVVKDKGPSPLDVKYQSDGYNKFLDKDGYPPSSRRGDFDRDRSE